MTHRLRQVHTAVGILFLAGFVASGQYMDLVQDHLVGMADGPRLMYRSAHIYLLFAALLNLLLGSYVQVHAERRPRLMQTVGSVMILLPPILLTVSFFVDAQNPALERPLASIGIYMLALGAVLHFFSRFAASPTAN